MFESRISKLRKQLLKEKLDAVLISSSASITYFSNFSNFSTLEREAYIFVGENFAYIITDGRYTEAVKRQVPHLTVFERGNGKSTEELFKKHQIKNIGVEEDNLTVSEHKIIKKHFKNIKHFSIKRNIKSKEEITKIEKACKLGDKAFEHAVNSIKLGITEKELAFEIELFIKRNGAELSFPTIVAFGKNSSIPHHQTSDKRLTTNDEQSSSLSKLILIDMGVKLEDYCSDMTRTVFFGKPDEKQKKMYKVVLEAQKKAVEFVKENVKASEVDKVARKYIISQGFPTIPHSLGHGIGLEVHEHPFISPKSKEVLKEGMVFSIEPGIYIEGFGGVRIEDLFVIENGKIRQLTKSNYGL